jgi:hypothetical protein
MDADREVRLDDHRSLWVTEISSATFEDQSLHDLGTDGGLFIVMEDTAAGTFTVLAKALDLQAALTLLQLVTAGPERKA